METNYILLKNNVEKIAKQINSLEEIHEELLVELKKGLFIDNDIPCSSELSKCEKNLKIVEKEICNELLVNINNKI